MDQATVAYRFLPNADYQQTWDLQTELHQALVSRKRAQLKALKAGLEVDPTPQAHQLLFVEHAPVYTLGKSGSMDHLLLDEQQLSDEGFQFYKINRGGDITYHGPGQLVAYPILDLEEGFFTDVHKYVRSLEEIIILMLAEFGLEAYREKGYTGVWLPATDELPKRKICAIGVHLSRWVSMHGLALNVDPNLSHFNHIIPCGIQEEDRSVTSMAKELNRPISLNEVIPVLQKKFEQVFDCRLSFSDEATTKIVETSI
ncbi:MAG: lipoyl(octanoyl) transferase LipB [Bacteroidota bacterium]